MKKVGLVFGLFFALVMAGCHNEEYVFPPYGNILSNLTQGGTVYNEVNYIVPSEGGVYKFQDIVGYLDWDWYFYVDGEQQESGRARFDSVLKFDDYMDLSFVARDEGERIQTIFPENVEKPYRFFEIVIPPNPTRTVREFSIMLHPVYKSNYIINPVRINFAQHLGD